MSNIRDSNGQETLETLAVKVGELTKVVTSYLRSEGLPTPTFSADSSAEYPVAAKLTAPRLELIGALTDMLHLAKGGKDAIYMESILAHHNQMVLDVLNQFSFWHAVPLPGSASYGDIAATTRLPESLVRRVLRYAMVNRLFAETSPGSGRIVHTSATAFLARNPAYTSWVGHNLEDVRPACTRLPDALRRFSSGRESATEALDESAFALEFHDRANSGGNFWAFLDNDGDDTDRGYRARRFVEVMQIARASSAIDYGQLLETGFDWESIGEGTVVDIGGSSGQDATLLARAHPKLKVVVQDQLRAQEAFEKELPHDLAARVSFQPHDFFEPQPAEGPTAAADVYFFKAVFHDWPDEPACRILRALVPSLQRRPGARLVLCEGLARPFDTADWAATPAVTRQMLSAMDLQMLVIFNAKERTVADWRALLALAHPAFDLIRVSTLPGGSWAVLEIVLREK